MANYNANININVSGQNRLNYVLNSVEKLNNIIGKLKPINLLSPGAGAGGDQIRVAAKQLNDFARAVVNFKPEGIQKRAKELSNTLAGASDQAEALTTALANVGLRKGGFKDQAAEVRNYALALDTASRNAARLSAISARVQREARVQNIATRFDVSPEQVEQRINNLRAIRHKRDREAAAAEYMQQKRAEDFELRLQRIRERNAQQQQRSAAVGRKGGGRFGDIASNAIIGGAFPLLFGQSGAAATGGALGGIVGSAFGGAGGFAGSLLGTLLGNVAGQANQVKELAADIGFSAQQTQLLATAFKQAGADFDKFAESVSRIQGIGLALEEQASAIQLASTLTESYGGKIDKITNAFTNALQTGKVTQATLNQLTSQGIPIQDALATKYNVSRDALLLMAKDGKISVQDLINTLINLAEESTKGPTQTSKAYKEAFDQINIAVDNLTKKVIESFNFQSDKASKTGENLAYRVSNAFTQIISAIEPVVTLLATTTGAFVNLGIQAVNALSGIPNLISNVANSIISMIPGLGSVYTTLSLIGNLTGNKGRKPGIATPLNLNQGMNQNWPEGISRPGTIPKIGTITAPGQFETLGKPGKADKAARDAARETEQIQKQLAAAKDLQFTEANRLKLTQTSSELQKQIVDAVNKQAQIQREYGKRIAHSKSAEETLTLQLAERNALETNGLELRAALKEDTEKITQSLTQIFESSKERLALEDKYQELISGGVNPELAKEFAQLELTAAKQTELLTLRIAELEAAKAKLNATSETAKALQDQIDKIREILKLQGQAVHKSKQETEEERKKRTEREKRAQDAKDREERLKDLYRGIVNTLEDGIIATIETGIDGLINGTKQLDEALKEVAAGVLRDIGNQLLRFAVNAGMRALFSGAFADGGVFTSNGVQKFARGGVVNRPTIFPFADGGTTRTGLMGEAGPEAIMPLQRDGNGRLGVNAMGLREAMAGGGMGGGAPVLNINFETTRFGDTEYVSRDQLEAAMSETRRQASRDGAQRGMTMTLDRLQQSPRTRSRLGMR